MAYPRHPCRMSMERNARPQDQISGRIHLNSRQTAQGVFRDLERLINPKEKFRRGHYMRTGAEHGRRLKMGTDRATARARAATDASRRADQCATREPAFARITRRTRSRAAADRPTHWLE